MKLFWLFTQKNGQSVAKLNLLYNLRLKLIGIDVISDDFLNPKYSGIAIRNASFALNVQLPQYFPLNRFPNSSQIVFNSFRCWFEIPHVFCHYTCVYYDLGKIVPTKNRRLWRFLHFCFLKKIVQLTSHAISVMPQISLKGLLCF